MSEISCRTNRINISGKVLIYLIFLVILIVNMFPILWVLITSLKPKNEVFRFPPVFIPSEFMFENFIKAFNTSGIASAFLNSILIASGSIIVTILIASYAAYGFSRFSFRFKNVLLILLIGSQMIPAVTNIVPLYIAINRVGLYDTKTVLILLYSAATIPFCVWIIKGYLDSVPQSIDESASIDGASYIRIFFNIILPLLSPIVAANIVFIFVFSWNEFYLNFVLTSSEQARTIPVALFSFQSNYDINWNQLSAASILALLPIVILFLNMQKQFISGLTHGALKG